MSMEEATEKSGMKKQEPITKQKEFEKETKEETQKKKEAYK